MTNNANANLPPLVGESRPFLEVLEQTSITAPLDRSVLVVGERGTGKELIAARLHYLSPRWQRPFITVNCAALPETLLETELFGHEAGAFTGAVRRRAGRFERADGGTLFLDEIATASKAVQEKLLRVVEYGEFERLGSSQPLTCDVRVVAAANIDLPAAAARGDFRLDLLDRLSFEVLTIPPLRARGDDIPVLAKHFGRGMAIEAGWPGFPGFSARAMGKLVAHSWPGNVRELKNAAERAVYRWPDPDQPVDSIILDPFASPYRLDAPATDDPSKPPSATDSGPGPQNERVSALAKFPTLDDAVAAYERGLLIEALEAAQHNQRLAAERSGLAYHQFRTRLRKHGLIGVNGNDG
jgi:psp operon transcriptional activator